MERGQRVDERRMTPLGGVRGVGWGFVDRTDKDRGEDEQEEVKAEI